MRFVLLLFFLLLQMGCARHLEDPIVAQMKVRNMQTRSFSGESLRNVSKEVIAVLQDEGYIIKSINSELGVITAERDISIEKFSSKFFAYLFSGRQARWKKHSLVEMTTNITDEMGRTKIRINFLVRVFDNLGRVVEVHQVLDDGAYIDFFNKVQKGLLSKAV